MADAGTLVNTTQNYVNAYSGAVTNFSGTNDLSPGMKTFYRTVMLENARDALVFAQLGRKQPLPAHEGKIVEWRKWNTLPDADTLTEGVIPEGKKFGQTAINVGITQQGLYVAITDQLDTHHVDNVHLGATEEVGASVGRSYDKLVRLALQQNTNTLYADAVNLSTGAKTPVATRGGLGVADTAYTALTPDTIHQAMTVLRKANAPTYDGSNYVAVVHPSVLYDLMSSKDWIDYHKYESTGEIFNGEVGKLFGVRFISTTLAPILRGDDLTAASRSLTVKTTLQAPGKTVAVDEAISEAEAAALAGRKVLINGTLHTIVSAADGAAGNATITTKDNVAIADGTDGKLIYPGEGGAAGVAVYQTFVFGKEAFAVIDPDGAGIETIIHDRTSGIGGPLNQFGTVGGKFSGAAKILYQERMVTIESTGKYSEDDVAN